MRSPLRAITSVSLFSLAVLCSAGCVASAGTSKAVLGQRLLDKYLSPGFTGDLDMIESIPLYLTVSIKGANLRREEGGWRYDWIEYTRNGPAGTSARIELGKRP